MGIALAIGMVIQNGREIIYHKFGLDSVCTW
jgi:hypothetical protein